jgi:hypothetical protein
MADSAHTQDSTPLQKVIVTKHKTKSKIDLELMHYRLGHQSFQSLLAASHENLWDDVTLRFAPETFCIGCKVATSRSKNRGHSIVSEQTKPGQVLFMDLQPNPAHQAIIKSHWFPYYLNVVCAYSRYGVLIPVYGSSTDKVIWAIEEFVTYHKPYDSYCLDDISELHVDAGSYFMSEQFLTWAIQYGIQIKNAGSHHQEMNGLAERRWQAIRIRAFSMLNHARLSHLFLHHALMYSWKITNILPLRGLLIINDSEESPATPFQVYFNKKPRAHRFKVFGCPIIAKAYYKKNLISGMKMDDRTIIQRGVRGIFLGFPINQAGYLYLQPATQEFGTSVDMSFDVYFHSFLAYPELIFHDALPTRSPTSRHISGDISSVGQTGDPMVLPDPNPPSEPWTPYTIFPPEKPDDLFSIDPAAFPISPKIQNLLFSLWTNFQFTILMNSQMMMMIPYTTMFLQLSTLQPPNQSLNLQRDIPAV